MRIDQVSILGRPSMSRRGGGRIRHLRKKNRLMKPPLNLRRRSHRPNPRLGTSTLTTWTMCVAMLEEKLAAARSQLSPHSFFIPDTEYLVDPTGLIAYLGEKVAVGDVCIYCTGKGHRVRYRGLARNLRLLRLSAAANGWEAIENDSGDEVAVVDEPPSSSAEDQGEDEDRGVFRWPL
ncbi:hypothetical protein DFH94DRAFT_847400 [Russula ochroleuca]|uniref:ZN622/Rei1/Reh1 zinc finger C2H2-type domain-containing protein n=1 Tax=Russula ochroleuca TaxID=152965 RepID=A0A9P5MPI2_9AGAM|nr:hypothetical protein DFH94DRAFT_847400 [Russula ochroleuca]